MSPRARLVGAWVLLVLCVVGWVASLLGFIARGEPLWVLSLSWLALILTALNIIATGDVRREQDEGSG